MSNHLGQIYSTTKNAEKYIVLNSQNVELSGNVKLTNGNLEVSNNLIFNTISIGNKIDFKETNNTTAYNILHDNLTANNDASLNNVEISGTIKLPDSSNNGYGLLGQVLSSNGATGAVSWTTPTDTTYSATGTGLSLVGTTFENTAPDQTLVLTAVDTPNPGLTIGGTYPSLTIGQPYKIMFHGTFNNKQRQSNTAPSLGGVRCCDGFNSNRFPPVGGGWDAGTGIFTAPRDCYMNFCWQGMMHTNRLPNGTNIMEGVILHQLSDGTFRYVRCQWITSVNDTPHNLYQASPCVSAVLYMAAGEKVRPAGTNTDDWRWWSLNSDTMVSFSGHNCD